MTAFISIHALREEGDANAYAGMQNMQIFLSTPSARKATPFMLHILTGICPISIHALREEGDMRARLCE